MDTYGVDITPFHIYDDGVQVLYIRNDSANNKGWFPKTLPVTLSEVNSGFETSWNDLAYWNETTGYTLDYSVEPNVLVSNITYASTYYTEYIPPCTENWIANDTTCNGINYTIQYYDNNVCGTTSNLPIDNGTIVGCTIPASGLTAYNQQVTQDLNNTLIPITIILLISIVGLVLLANFYPQLNKTMYIIAGIIGVVLIILVIMILVNPLSLIT